MSYATFATIGLDELLEETKMMIRGSGDTTDDDPLLRKSIKIAINEIKAYGTMTPQNGDLKFTKGKAPVPCNFIRFNAEFPIRLNDSLTEPNNISSGSYPVYWEQTVFMRGTNFQPVYNTFQMQDECIVLLSTNYEGTGQISFLGTLVDSSGQPIIYDRYKEAIIAHAMWKFYLKYPELTSSEIRRDWAMRWANGKMEYQGTDATPDGPEITRINYLMNRLWP